MALHMQRTKADRKPGRKMPDTREVIDDQGFIDHAAFKDAVTKDMIASFNAHEYIPLTHAESPAGGDNIFIAGLRFKASAGEPPAGLPRMDMAMVQAKLADFIQRLDGHKIILRHHTIIDFGAGLELYVLYAKTRD